MDIFKYVSRDPLTCAAAIVSGTYCSYFILYSGYKKNSPADKGLATFNGSLALGELLPPMLGPSALGSKASNRQLNKVWALAGLTLSGLASLPEQLAWKGMGQERNYVLQGGVGSLVLHVSYSFASYYNFNPMKLLRGEGKSMPFEQLAVAAGSLSISCFTWAAWKVGVLKFLPSAQADDSKLLAIAGLAGMTHFYFMETRSGLPGDLPVRPWGYWAFIMPALAAGLWFRG